MSAKQTTLLKNLGLLVGTLVALFIVLELVARAVLYWSGDIDRFVRYASVKQLNASPKLWADYLKYEPHRYLGYIPTPNYAANDNRHNALGYRDDEITLPKPRGEFRIVCLGGSTTYTPAVGHYQYSYPKVLERELHERGYPHVRVINGGVDGWTSYETLVDFALRTVDLDPDMVILHQGINDVFTRIVWPATAYRGDNSGYQKPLETEIVMPGILEYSTLIRGILIRLGRIEPHASKTRMWLTSRYAPTFYGLEFERQHKAGEYPSGIFEEASLGDMLDANPPTYFERNLEHLLVLANHHNIKVVLATIAIFPDTANPGNAGLVISPEFLEECAEARATLEKLAQEHDAAFFDFHQRFPKVEGYFRDAVHVTFEGVQVKGKLFADFLIDEGLVPGAPLNQKETPATIADTHTSADSVQ